MPRSDKRLLRFFLEQYLDSGLMKSLQWIDKKKNIFQLLWLHANSPSWSEEDGALFKEWAIYKGRYKSLSDGTLPPDDYTNWKANFRCAINRCKDISILTNETGHKELRWYQFVDRRNARSMPPPLMWHSGHDGEDSESVDSDYKVTSSETKFRTPIMPTNTDTYAIAAFASDTENQFIPDVVAALPVSPPSSIGAQVDMTDGITPSTSNFLSSPVIDQQVEEQIINYGVHVDISDLLQWHPDDAERNVYSLLDMASLEASGIDPQQYSVTNVTLPESLSLLKFTQRPDTIDMCIWLRYRERVVGTHYIRDERGCRVVNVDGEKHPVIPERYTGCKLIGSPPPGNTIMMRDVEDTELILKNLGNGIHFFCDTDGNIFATRLTSCRIYYADPTLKAAGEPQVLPRKQPVKVFDRESFSKNLAQWEKGGARGERPSVSVLLAVGENWSLTKPINKCKINLTLVHAYSWYKRMNIKENAPLMDFDDARPGTDTFSQLTL